MKFTSLKNPKHSDNAGHSERSLWKSRRLTWHIIKCFESCASFIHQPTNFKVEIHFAECGCDSHYCSPCWSCTTSSRHGQGACHERSKSQLHPLPPPHGPKSAEMRLVADLLLLCLHKRPASYSELFFSWSSLPSPNTLSPLVLGSLEPLELPSTVLTSRTLFQRFLHLTPGRYSSGSLDRCYSGIKSAWAVDWTLKYGIRTGVSCEVGYHWWHLSCKGLHTWAWKCSQHKHFG